MLAWAAANGRILLTHDIQTVPAFAYERIRAERPMPGVIVVPKELGIGVAIADLRIVIACGTESDFDRAVVYLPLRNA